MAYYYASYIMDCPKKTISAEEKTRIPNGVVKMYFVSHVAIFSISFMVLQPGQHNALHYLRPLNYQLIFMVGVILSLY